MNSVTNKKQDLVLWRELVLIGFAILFVAAANKQQGASLSPDIQPVNLTPESTVSSPVIIEST